MGLRICEFDSGFAPEAAALFCSQFRLQRSATPILPTTSNREENVAPLISGLRKGVPGVAAFDGPRLVGYIIGFRVPKFMGLRDGVYSPEWAHGAKGEERGSIYRCMYKAAAERWVPEGYLVHSLTCLADDAEANEALSLMGFGVTTVDAMMRSRRLSKYTPTGVKIETISSDRIDDVVPLSKRLEEHLKKSPSFAPHQGRRWREYYAKFLSSKEKSVWVAYKSGRAVSFMKCEPSTEPGACQVVRDPKVLKISGAYTVPELRGRGIASAVLSELLETSKSAFPKCSVDFESANLSASDFWLEHFTPVCYTLARHVDERILRAHR